jgi:hypothetical protein
LNEVDLYLFANKTIAHFAVDEKSDWGFRHADGAISYLRHKSKSGDEINMASYEGDLVHVCKIQASKLPKNQKQILDKTSFTFIEVIEELGQSLASKKVKNQ